METTESIVPCLSSVCRFDDDPDYYEQTLLNYVSNSAARYLGLLHILADGYPLAGSLLKQCNDVNEITSLFLKYRELEAEARSLLQAYVNADREKINFRLIELYSLFAPSTLGFSIGQAPLNEISLDSSSVVHFPLLRCTVVPSSSRPNLGQLTAMVIERQRTGDEESTELSYRKDLSTRPGVRVSRSTMQPLKAGDEFHLIEDGHLPSSAAEVMVCQAVNSLANLDGRLSACLSACMRLITVVPRNDKTTRKSSSVSSLPGWAWQDVDLEADQLVEHCHLCMQLVHEFFHTKLNLVEKNVRLYITDGNSPEVFSPWKGKERPLRQVIHALLTFCAGAIAFAKLLESKSLSGEKLYPLAEECWAETTAFAEEAHQGLLATGALTSDGRLLIDSCVDNLHSVVGMAKNFNARG